MTCSFVARMPVTSRCRSSTCADQVRHDEGRDLDSVPEQVDGVGAPFLELHLAPPAQLIDEVVEVGGAVDAEVDIAARTVGRKAPDGLAADHEPMRKCGNGFGQVARHYLRGPVGRRHRILLARMTAMSRPRLRGRHPRTRAAW